MQQPKQMQSNAELNNFTRAKILQTFGMVRRKIDCVEKFKKIFEAWKCWFGLRVCAFFFGSTVCFLFAHKIRAWYGFFFLKFCENIFLAPIHL